jgi:hypothetical protein
MDLIGLHQRPFFAEKHKRIDHAIATLDRTDRRLHELARGQRAGTHQAGLLNRTHCQNVLYGHVVTLPAWSACDPTPVRGRCNNSPTSLTQPAWVLRG